MNLLFALAVAASAWQQPALDTTIAVSAGTRLRADVRSGSIQVRVWDRSAVRVVSTGAGGERPLVQASASLVSVWSSARRPNAAVALDITVPRGMGVTLGGDRVEITVNGGSGEVVARNGSGRIAVNGGSGLVSAESTLGDVDVSNARGRITARSHGGRVRVLRVSGDVEAESSQGHVVLAGVDATRLRATTTGGVIQFSGPIRAGGHYSFTTHDGSIRLLVPEPLSATVSVSTVSGGFSSDFPYQVRERRGRGLFTAVVGRGDATVDLASFEGGIVIRRAPPAGAPSP